MKCAIKLIEKHSLNEYKKCIQSLDRDITTENYYIDRLEHHKKYVKKDTVSVKYFHKLKGSNGEAYGRLYSENGFQTMDSNMRHHFARDFYVGLDLNNCHPNLLNCLFKHYNIDCPEMDRYCKSRQEVIEDYGIGKSFVNMICNYAVYPESMIKKKFDVKCNEYFKKIHDCVYESLVPILKSNEPHMYEAVVKSKKAKNEVQGKDTHESLEGAFIATYLMTLENNIIMSIKQFFDLNNYSVDAIVHDEILVRKDKDLEQVVNSLKNVIKNTEYRGLKMDFDQSFKIVKFQEFELFKNAKIRKGLDNENDSKEREAKDDYEFEFVSKMFETFNNRIKFYNETLYLKDFDYKWYSSSNTNNILIRWMYEVSDKFSIVLLTSKMETIKKVFIARASAEFVDNDLKRKFSLSTKNMICFNNGYLDMITKNFVEWKDADDSIYTDVMIDYNYETGKESVKQEIYERILFPIFDDNVELMKEYLMYCARALAMSKDKFWMTASGERDSGKGVLTELFKQAFSVYVFDFYSSSLMLRKNLEGEIRNTWAEPFVKYRLGFCNETMDTTEDGSKKAILDGTKIKKLASGGDEINIKLMKENQKSEAIKASFIMFQNSLPACSPADALQNMLTFNFPCYFSDKPRAQEFAKMRKIDMSLKNWIETNKDIRCAMVDIIIDHFQTSVPDYVLFKQNAQDVKDLCFEEDYDLKLKELFVFTKNLADVLSTKEIDNYLKQNSIVINAPKLKSRLEHFGAKYGNYRINKIKSRGYAGIKFVSTSEETDEDDCEL